jgi:hypothetical protein
VDHLFLSDRGAIPPVDFIPIHKFEEGLEVLGPAILALQVVGMFPHV